jgi:DNA-binding beta-propeller fold protein YncE
MPARCPMPVRCPVVIPLIVVVGALVFVSPAAAAPPTIPVGSNPIEMSIAQKSASAVVADDGGVSFLNLKTGQQTNEISTGVHHGQSAIALGAGGTKAYVGVFALDYVVVVNVAKQSVVGKVTVGQGADAIVSSGGRVYVGLLNSSRVAVINPASDTVVKNVKLPQGAQSLAVAPGGRSIWVGSAVSAQIYVIDTKTLKIVRRLSAQKAGPVQSMVFAPKDKRVLVSGLGGVSALNPASGKVVRFATAPKVFPTSPAPNVGPLVLNPRGTKAMVLNSTFPDAPGLGTVSVINPLTLKFLKSITVGLEPTDIKVDRSLGTTYVVNYGADTVSYFHTPG